MAARINSAGIGGAKEEARLVVFAVVTESITFMLKSWR